MVKTLKCYTVSFNGDFKKKENNFARSKQKVERKKIKNKIRETLNLYLYVYKIIYSLILANTNAFIVVYISISISEIDR